MLINLRMSHELRSRARVCADDVHLPLSEWCRRAMKHIHNYETQRVEIPDELRNTTRSESVPVTVNVPPNAQNEPTEKLREAVACAVLHCESVRKPPFVPHTNFYEVVENER